MAKKRGRGSYFMATVTWVMTGGGERTRQPKIRHPTSQTRVPCMVSDPRGWVAVHEKVTVRVWPEATGQLNCEGHFCEAEKTDVPLLRILRLIE